MPIASRVSSRKVWIKRTLGSHGHWVMSREASTMEGSPPAQQYWHLVQEPQLA